MPWVALLEVRKEKDHAKKTTSQSCAYTRRRTANPGERRKNSQGASEVELEGDLLPGRANHPSGTKTLAGVGKLNIPLDMAESNPPLFRGFGWTSTRFPAKKI